MGIRRVAHVDAGPLELHGGEGAGHELGEELDGEGGPVVGGEEGAEDQPCWRRMGRG